MGTSTCPLTHPSCPLGMGVLTDRGRRPRLVAGERQSRTYSEAPGSFLGTMTTLHRDSTPPKTQRGEALEPLSETREAGGWPSLCPGFWGITGACPPAPLVPTFSPPQRSSRGRAAGPSATQGGDSLTWSLGAKTRNSKHKATQTFGSNAMLSSDGFWFPTKCEGMKEKLSFLNVVIHQDE